MKEQLAKLTEHWNSLQPREQWILGGGVAFVLVFIFYIGIWKPAQEKQETLAMRVQAQTETVAWMNQAAGTIMQLRTQGNTAASKGTLLSIIDKTSKQMKISEQIRHLEPSNQNMVKLRFEQVSFDALTNWLQQLDSNYQVFVDSLSIDQEKVPGRVNARITLVN